MQLKLGRFNYIHHLNPLHGEVHSHPKHEYVYCIGGEGRVEIGGKPYKFNTGTIYVAAAGTPHSEHDFTESEIIYFYFDLPLSELREGVFHDLNGTVLPILRKIQNEERNRFLLSDEMKNALLAQLLIETRRTESNRRVDRGLISTIEYIDENLRENLDIHRLANKAGYSYHRFRHAFKDQTGVAPGEYIIDRRIDMAKKLMENDISASLTYIAYECGFSTSSHFSNSFKAKTGMSPSEYRRMSKSEKVGDDS